MTRKIQSFLILVSFTSSSLFTTTRILAQWDVTSETETSQLTVPTRSGTRWDTVLKCKIQKKSSRKNQNFRITKSQFSSIDSAYEGDPIMSKYYTESGGSSRRTSAFSGTSTESLDKKLQKSDRSNRQKTLPKAPQIMPIRIRRYYEKESDSSGVCDSGNLWNFTQIQINFYFQPIRVSLQKLQILTC